MFTPPPSPEIEPFVIFRTSQPTPSQQVQQPVGEKCYSAARGVWFYDKEGYVTWLRSDLDSDGDLQVFPDDMIAELRDNDFLDSTSEVAVVETVPVQPAHAPSVQPPDWSALFQYFKLDPNGHWWVDKSDGKVYWREDVLDNDWQETVGVAPGIPEGCYSAIQ